MDSRIEFLAKASPLLLVLFIDSMGLGLIFPLLNALIFDPQTHFLNNALLSPFMHNAIYGIVIGIFMLCWFFGAAILGDLSDKIGRKKALSICLLGTCLGYLVSALAIGLHSIILLVLGRVIAGFTAGSQPIAQAAIIDISHPEQKARNIGYIQFIMSIGFVFGPLLGGVLSNNHVVSWFQFSTPFYFAAILSALNIVLLWALFKETFLPTASKFSIHPYHAIEIFISAFRHEKVRKLSVLYFIFIMGWSSFYSFIAVLLTKRYGFSPTEVSIYMALMGAGFGIGNGFLVEHATKKFALFRIFWFSCITSALGAFFIAFIPHALLSWAMIIPMACFIVLAYAAIMTLFSNQVGPEAQGWVMGITGSIMALVFGIDGMALGFIVSLSVSSPIYIAAFCLMLAGALTYSLRKL